MRNQARFTDLIYQIDKLPKCKSPSTFVEGLLCPGLDLQNIQIQSFRPLCAVCEPIFQGVLVLFPFPRLLLTAVTRNKVRKMCHILSARKTSDGARLFAVAQHPSYPVHASGTPSYITSNGYRYSMRNFDYITIE